MLVAKPLHRKKRISAYSLVEVIMVVAIIGIGSGIFVATMSGSGAKDALGRASQQIHDDLIMIRTRAVSEARLHRVRFLSDASWVTEHYDDTLATPAWVQNGDVHRMPSDTNLVAGSFENAGSNLEATPRGMFQFQNGCSGSPYVSIEARGASQNKSIYVYTGGAIEVRTQ